MIPVSVDNNSMSRLLLPRQTGLLLGFTDEAHGSVERAVVAVGRVAGDGHADLFEGPPLLI